MTNLLEIKDLEAGYDDLKIISDINLKVKKGEILGIVGESGSGKSTLLKSIMQIRETGVKVFKGEILFNGNSILNLPKKENRMMRGNHIGVIFQNPGASLNPTRKIKKQFEETLKSHKTDLKDFEEAVLNLFEKLNLKNGRRILNSYPFELSGGMNQRVAIAIAMILNPELLLADEPTSALDAPIQYQVIEEMIKIRNDFKNSIVVITHNMGVVSKMADNVAIMYGGRILEYGDVKKILKEPKHPYTKALLDAIPKLNGNIPKSIDVRNLNYGELESEFEKVKSNYDKGLFKIQDDYFINFLKIG